MSGVAPSPSVTAAPDTGRKARYRQSPRGAAGSMRGAKPASGERSTSTVRLTATPSARQRGQPPKTRGSAKRAAQRGHLRPTTRTPGMAAGTVAAATRALPPRLDPEVFVRRRVGEALDAVDRRVLDAWPDAP